MPNYLFDLRLWASVRVDAENESAGRAMIKAALDCADVNAGAWPDGSPILFEASLDDDDCSDEGAMVLIEVDGEDPEAPPPPPAWAAPVQGMMAAPMFKAHAIRAALAQERAAQLFPAWGKYEPDDPGIGDALAYGMAAHRVTAGIDRAAAPDQGVTVLMVRIPREDFIETDEVAAAMAELRAAIDRAAGIEEPLPRSAEDSTNV